MGDILGWGSNKQLERYANFCGDFPYHSDGSEIRRSPVDVVVSPRLFTTGLIHPRWFSLRISGTSTGLCMKLGLSYLDLLDM